MHKIYIVHVPRLLWYWPRHVGLGRGRGRGSGDNICDIIDHRKSLHPASRNPTLRRENLSTPRREIRPCVEKISPPCVEKLLQESLDPASRALHPASEFSTLRRKITPRISRPCVESSPPCVGVLDPASKNYPKNLSTLRRELSTLRRSSRPCVESSPPCVERLLFLLQTACHKSAYCLWACRMHCQQRRGRRQGLFEIVSRYEGKKGICLSLTLSIMTVKSKLVPRRWERDMSSFRFSSQSSSQLDFFLPC